MKGFQRFRSFKALLATLAVASAAACGGAWAQTTDAQAKAKLAPDLVAAMHGTKVLNLPWLREVDGEVLVKVLVLARSDDASLAPLRQAVLAMGGTVYYNYLSIRGVSVMLPATRLLDLARRDDVESVSPNRPAMRTASLMRSTTGAVDAGRSTGSRLDGTGVGIAILDSGIAATHQNLWASRNGVKLYSRIRDSVDMVKVGKGVNSLGWSKQTDWSNQVQATLGGTRYDSALALGTLAYENHADPYGHGTHVASVAAGSGSYQSPDSTGVAPNADVYDVRVLDERGLGTVGDVIAGIDWVMQHSRLYNIRVMNLSLAAASGESFLTDPLARAARSASASGIVVVVAAGNAGKTADGREIFGAIGSPGHDPSVITVGASNPLATAARSDDIMTSFSSRGPTRGRTTLEGGELWIDNLVKPDLVAPGNRIVAALGADTVGFNRSWNRLATDNPQLTACPAPPRRPTRR
jgi:serine protease AprX